MLRKKPCDDADMRSLERSPYRSMPSSCDHCGYKNRPSSSGTNCSICCLKLNQNVKDER